MAVETIKFGHTSLQFSDGDRAHTADIEKVFGRGNHIQTGTEAGPGAGNTSEELLRIGREAGYRMWVPSSKQKRPAGVKGFATDCWIGVREDLISGGWEVGFIDAIPGSSELYEAQGIDPRSLPRWGPKGLVTVGFDTENLGRINVGSAHYLTQGRRPGSIIKGVDHYEWNKRLAEVIGDWAREVGAGKDLALYGGDQNIVDREDDTFFGQPMISGWDLLEFYQNTGHGNIDVIAKYKKDGRATFKRIRAFNDEQFFLNTDHFHIEATIEIEVLPPKATLHKCAACGFEHLGVVTA